MKTNRKSSIDNRSSIVILGGGESGVGTAILAKKQGFEVFVSDFGKIKDKYKQVLINNEIEWEEQGHSEAKILAADLVMKSPGIPEKAPMVQKLREKGVKVISEIEFAAKFTKATIVGITGSNGKTTTASLTYEVLKNGGLNVALGGNIGKSFAEQVAEEKYQNFVLEISSFQLDDIETFAPHIAVLTNLSPDHLDRYEYKYENYIASKFRITMNQTEKDYLVYNADDPVITSYLVNHSFHAQKNYFTMNPQNMPNAAGYIQDGQMHVQVDGEDLQMSIHDLSIQGKHNQFNSMAAGISARIAGLRKEKIRESFTTFEGLEHRLEFVATVRGVDFINDSKATNVNSVWFALESMKRPTILILGGQDKGNDYNEIAEIVREKVKAIVCMGVNNAPIHEAFEGVVSDIADAASATEAVAAAFALASPGDVVLLSPACASFDLFKNYEDRGRQFKEAVRAL